MDLDLVFKQYDASRLCTNQEFNLFTKFPQVNLSPSHAPIPSHQLTPAQLVK